MAALSSSSISTIAAGRITARLSCTKCICHQLMNASIDVPGRAMFTVSRSNSASGRTVWRIILPTSTSRSKYSRHSRDVIASPFSGRCERNAASVKWVSAGCRYTMESRAASAPPPLSKWVHRALIPTRCSRSTPHTTTFDTIPTSAHRPTALRTSSGSWARHIVKHLRSICHTTLSSAAIPRRSILTLRDS